MAMENPTLAVLSAGHGLSFVPSPATPTISPIFFRVSTRISLSSGEERVKTCSRGNSLHPVLLIQPTENRTFHDDAALGEDAALSSNRPSGKHVVKRNRQRETYGKYG